MIPSCDEVQHLARMMHEARWRALQAWERREEDGVKVREMMTTPVTTLEPNDNLAFAEELMTVERVRHLPVVDGDVLVGILSQRDIMAAAIPFLNDPSTEQDLEAKRKVRVDEVMRGGVETISPDDDAVKAADILLAHKVGSLPVVDERHRLLGIVTESDFVSLAREALATGVMVPRSPVVLAGAMKRR
jgi:CBS domain-containing protein